MIYTIGHIKNYLKAINDSPDGKIQKLGRCEPSNSFPDGYEGGYAFKTAEDAKINYEGADYVFAKHGGAIYWMDLDIDDPMNNDDDWVVGTLEDAALEFRDEFDPEFELITQTEASKIANISVAAINNAIRDGRLNSYKKDNAPAHKPGSNLVNKSDVFKVWPNRIE